MSFRVSEGAEAVRRRLPPVPSSVSEARRVVRDLLTRAERADLADTAALLVSELVTNAMLHAGSTIDLVVGLDGRSLVVEVTDGSRNLPMPRHYADTAGTGRGLRMLEQLVDDWGVRRHADGKTVWFVLGAGRSHPRAAVDEDDLGDPGGEIVHDLVEVELLDVPLLMHVAWQEHAQALLRELLLATLDDESGEPDAIALHAEATDALAILQEHLPGPGVDLSPDVLMRDATEPLVSAALVRVPVRRDSVRHFATLEQAVLVALELAGQADALTPPTQPEIQHLRHWLCGQVLAQAEGRPPHAWSMPVLEPSRSEPPPGWDPRPVAQAPTALLAADDTNRLLAVSGPAAALLGYDDPAELVGRQILEVVPVRYRQAHVAGFTLMQLTGRRPLLDHPVALPVLRRDGEELAVTMLVSVQQVGDGRSVFVADLRPST